MATRLMRRLLWSLVACCLLSLAPLQSQADLIQAAPSFRLAQQANDDTGLYRTRVVLRTPTDRARLDTLGVVVLTTEDGGRKTDEKPTSALVLADEAALESLARLRYEPTDTVELALLVTANAPVAPWLAKGMTPLLAQAAQLKADAAERKTESSSVVRPSPSVALKSLSSAQVTALSNLTSVDDDGDGLTNTQESWWCTDPLNADSDNDGSSDKVEVQQAKDWLANRRSGYPASGPPYKGWPMVPGDGNFNAQCVDRDQDVVPDAAETWELGLNPNRESTDRDKFDDGQELFGLTKYGYGALPRSEDAGTIFAEMPSWVKAPGNHPFVAAFPVPEIDVVPSSLNLQTVTVVTTDHTIQQNESRSYSTAKTEGTSTAVADSTTWNDWDEVSTTTALNGAAKTLDPQFDFNDAKKWVTDAAKTVWDAGDKCLKSINGQGDTVCSRATKLLEKDAVKGVQQITTAAVGTIIHTVAAIPDAYQAATDPKKCPGGVSQQISCFLKATGTRLNDEFYTRLGKQAEEGQEPNGTGTGSRFQFSGSNMTSQPIYQLSWPAPPFVPTQTSTHGSSNGGSHTTTHTQYEEQTVTNGQQFGSATSWGTATAVDSAHAADLSFTYKVRNSGTEYAREIANLAFNIYLGDNPNPVYTYFVAPDLGGDGKFHTFMPGEEHTYTSRRIPLTLEQMKTLDLSGPVRIVIEDFTYGNDELFYQDAVTAGVRVGIEDGMDDGDEAIDTYLIPTWADGDKVQDVIARYFPNSTDADGNITAIWTPEQGRTDAPAWCVDRRLVGTAIWCRHALSTDDWWNIYLNHLGDGTASLKDTTAQPNSTVFFRFNKDTDLDGYSDRSEQRLGTNPADPASHPSPQLIAGLHTKRAGNTVVGTLSFLNTGLYDAYGVEAVMIAPDDSVSITNNTVGGSGRVRAQRSVIVGSRLLPPTTAPATWTGTAKPAAGGYYTGAADLTYTFTVGCSNPGGCDVGAGTWSLNWSDGTNSGSLPFGAGYASPTLVNVGAYGVQVSLLTGKVYNGNSFTVQAKTPADTFQYTINREPYTAPIVLVSYNDPQGNHRFITPVTLIAPTDNLAGMGGQMLPDPGVEIVTTTAFSQGSNTTNLVVNNPTGTTLTNAHLFLEFVDPAGTVVHEATTTATLPAGPSVVPITWNTSAFSPAYNAAQDYIVMAFWTDYEGNILDTAGRPLSSFQADPKAESAMASGDETWDFGTAQQGTLLQRQFTLASVGFMDLLTYLGTAQGITVTGPTSRALAPGDFAPYTVTLNTQYLPTGPFSRTIPVRTSDPLTPSRTITIQGTITPLAPDGQGGATLRPLDWTASIPGDHSQGEWVQYDHTLGPNPDTLHPVKVYDQGYTTLKGVDDAASVLGMGTASAAVFGDGRDGDIVINNGRPVILMMFIHNCLLVPPSGLPGLCWLDESGSDDWR
ncbi:MAG: hypothetical protein KIT87_12955 [Anaerolineae bacterium]|nr:hypothetical protein [Anaerolineae bacterium]